MFFLKNRSAKRIKNLFVLLSAISFIFTNICYAAIVSDNDGSAFITKAEFDSLKNNFQSQIDNYNQSLDSKIDLAIASYLSGVELSSVEILPDYIKLVGNYGANYVTFNSYDASHSPNDTKNRAGEYTLYNSYGRCFETASCRCWDFSINNGNMNRADVFVPCSTHGRSTHALLADKVYLNGIEVGYEPINKYYYNFSHLFNQFSCDMKAELGDAVNYNWNDRGSAYPVSFNERCAEYSAGSFNQFGTKLNYTKVHCGLYNEDTAECGDWVLTLPGGSYKQTNKVASITTDELGFFNGTQYTENIKAPDGWITVMMAGSDSNVQFNWTWYDWKYEYDYPTKWLNAGATKLLSKAVYKYEGIPIFKTGVMASSISFKFKVTENSRVVISKKKFTNTDLTTSSADYVYINVCTANTEYSVNLKGSSIEDDTIYWVKICPITVNRTATINIVGNIEQKLK